MIELTLYCISYCYSVIFIVADKCNAIYITCDMFIPDRSGPALNWYTLLPGRGSQRIAVPTLVAVAVIAADCGTHHFIVQYIYISR